VTSRRKFPGPVPAPQGGLAHGEHLGGRFDRQDVIVFVGLRTHKRSLDNLDHGDKNDLRASVFPASAAATLLACVVFTRVRDPNVVLLGRSVWRATDDKDPLVRSLLEITNSVHRSK
jgi:hypothetical protein